MSPIVFLESNTIFLRPLEQKDLSDKYIQWLNDEEVCRFNSHAVFPYTSGKMNDYLSFVEKNSERNIVLAIIAKDSKEHIGNISLQNISWINRSAEFAILVGDKKYWNKGVGAEAAMLICDYGFKRLNLHRIYCGTLSENIGMKKLAVKLGMEQEGIRRQAIFKNGVYLDILEYGVLKDEFYNK